MRKDISFSMVVILLKPRMDPLGRGRQQGCTPHLKIFLTARETAPQPFVTEFTQGSFFKLTLALLGIFYRVIKKLLLHLQTHSICYFLSLIYMDITHEKFSNKFVQLKKIFKNLKMGC